MLNKMCNDCGCLHRDCDGTENQNWTNCVYKEKIVNKQNKDELKNNKLETNEIAPK